jgi:hypothetical protein
MIVRNNHFWDNWRRGTMLFASPTSSSAGRPESTRPCSPAAIRPRSRRRPPTTTSSTTT